MCLFEFQSETIMKVIHNDIDQRGYLAGNFCAQLMSRAVDILSDNDYTIDSNQ